MGRLAALFPTFQLVLMAGCGIGFYLSGEVIYLLLLLAVVYVLPLVIFRIHEIFFPLRDEIVDIAEKRYNRWWTSHQLQMLLIAIPVFEAVLRLVPGLFSLWLRMWGSSIGRGVYWTPKVEIIDRSLLDIGDGVIIGHMAAFCSHAITPIDGKMSLIVQRIRVGRRAFVGAEGRLGPGAVLEAGKTLRVRSAIYWKGVFKE